MEGEGGEGGWYFLRRGSGTSPTLCFHLFYFSWIREWWMFNSLLYFSMYYYCGDRISFHVCRLYHYSSCCGMDGMTELWNCGFGLILLDAGHLASCS